MGVENGVGVFVRILDVKEENMVVMVEEDVDVLVATIEDDDVDVISIEVAVEVDDDITVDDVVGSTWTKYPANHSIIFQQGKYLCGSNIW